MKSELIELPVTVSEEELLDHVTKLNNDDSIHGILVQLPLPNHIDENLVIRAIDPAKDVDGFHPENVGKMIIGQRAFLSCTPYGIIKLLNGQAQKLEANMLLLLDAVILSENRWDNYYCNVMPLSHIAILKQRI